MRMITFFSKNSEAMFASLGQHIALVLIAVGLGMAIAIPSGVLLTRHKKIAPYFLALAGTVQTIPGLVMLGFALIIMGIGTLPALAVLTIYSILPILRNTYTGITEVQPAYKDAAKGIGMSKRQVLFKVELPLALPTIVSGIRISAVYIVSWATLAGMIGAGGLGDWIWTGLATYNTDYILAGAIPSAILAFAFSALIGLVQKLITPRGLRRNA
ncbi:osmoprotectant transport system permease protein [Sphaerochaeta associata]|uniref:ABC transporter permease n=1 Tax=Sphaerochaeta associata TaxID=1129264 RepID=A0ABY4DG39_9SPIR|nr:ABC transporter permease [Sphaerochaeta associata]UOM51897.1 ABC transporter permease [Sphaerochaeta associata]SMP58731.1 osmoprotectant transport system permease protein [Sphaerochaeta associata]